MKTILTSSPHHVTPFKTPPVDSCWQAISQLLIVALRPARVYRIEHQLSGTAGRIQYHNLIVVLPNNDTRPIREYEPILQLTNAATDSVQCSFHKAKTVATWILERHPFFCRNLIPANLIYDDGSLTFPEPEPAVMEAMIEHLAQQFKIFFSKAEAFYQCALQMHAEHPNDTPALATFMLHQAVELGYRSILESLNGYCKKTHELRQLRNQTFRCAPALGEVFPDDSAFERSLVDLLESAYSGARYDNQFRTDSRVLAVLFDRAQTFLMVAKALGGARITGVKSSKTVFH